MVLKGSAALSRASSNLRTKKGNELEKLGGRCHLWNLQSCLDYIRAWSCCLEIWLSELSLFYTSAVQSSIITMAGAGACYAACGEGSNGILRTYVRKGHISLILFMCSSCLTIWHMCSNFVKLVRIGDVQTSEQFIYTGEGKGSWSQNTSMEWMGAGHDRQHLTFSVFQAPSIKVLGSPMHW